MRQWHCNLDKRARVISLVCSIIWGSKTLFSPWFKPHERIARVSTNKTSRLENDPRKGGNLRLCVRRSLNRCWAARLSATCPRMHTSLDIRCPQQKRLELHFRLMVIVNRGKSGLVPPSAEECGQIYRLLWQTRLAISLLHRCETRDGQCSVGVVLLCVCVRVCLLVLSPFTSIVARANGPLQQTLSCWRPGFWPLPTVTMISSGSSRRL